MEAKIKIVQPGIILTLNIEVDDDIIIARLFVIARTSANKATCTNAEIYWFSVSDMERDIKQFLDKIMTGNETVESRMVYNSGDLKETERQIRAVLFEVLEFQDR